MSAVSRFLDQQSKLGRVALVALCMVAPTQVMAQDTTGMRATIFSDEGPLERDIPRSEMRQKLSEVISVVDRNLDAISAFHLQLDEIGTSNASVSEKLVKIRSAAKATLDTINTDRDFRYDFANIQIIPGTPGVSNAELLTARSNRLNEFFTDAESTLKEMIFAVEKGDLRGIDDAYNRIDKQYLEQAALERDLRDMGFTTREALKGL